MARTAASRFDPLVCRDDQGRYVGLLRVERLIERVAAAGLATGPLGVPHGVPAAQGEERQSKRAAGRQASRVPALHTGRRAPGRKLRTRTEAS